MNFIGSKKIETDRLILRPTEESDLKTLWGILLDTGVNKYYLTSKINRDWDKEKLFQMKKLEHANDNDMFQWSIIKKDTKECIGQISVQEKEDMSKDIRDIGWFISSEEQRKGYAYEAANAILNYMFNEVEITKIDTSAAIENIASWKLMEKLEFKRKEQIKKVKYTFIDDFVESYTYDLTKEDYNK
ncbi:MAG: GNAT family N-acetyltransferase [Bacilli bacterium]|nr:GNAT family N-acetyltransferase [Bacilli bacterium]